MMNELEVHAQHHRGWINTDEPRELVYWMDHLHADADMVKEAVEAVGPDEDRVREHLQARLH